MKRFALLVNGLPFSSDMSTKIFRLLLDPATVTGGRVNFLIIFWLSIFLPEFRSG